MKLYRVLDGDQEIGITNDRDEAIEMFNNHTPFKIVNIRLVYGDRVSQKILIQK